MFATPILPPDTFHTRIHGNPLQNAYKIRNPEFIELQLLSRFNKIVFHPLFSPAGSEYLKLNFSRQRLEMLCETVDFIILREISEVMNLCKIRNAFPFKLDAPQVCQSLGAT